MSSEAEEAFAAELDRLGLGFTREFAFHPARKWRFDFCWPSSKLAVEIDGSGHRRVTTYRKDTEKNNAAMALGWRVLHFQACDWKPSRSRVIYPGGAADWAQETLAVLCDAI